MRHLRLHILLLTLLLLAACGGQAEPALDSTDLDQPQAQPPDQALAQDAAAMAADLGISPEEAADRLSAQDAIGLLQGRLAQEMPDRFGGLWIEYQPAYRIVVALTEGGPDALQPYLNGAPWEEQIDVVAVSHSLRQLESDQAAATKAVISRAGAFATYIDIMRNQVLVEIANPDQLLADLAADGVRLPETVTVIGSDAPQREPASNYGAVIEGETADGQPLFLPVQAPSGSSMAALMEGELRLQDGCLRLYEDAGSAGWLIIWPNDTQFGQIGPQIELLNGQGEPVALTGSRLRLGGGAMESPTAGDRLAESIPGMPIDGCPGPYWIAAPLESLAEQAVPDIYADPFSSGGLLAMFLYQSRPAEPDGEIRGELTVDEGKCLRVAGYTVLWPPEVWPREAPLRLVRTGEIPLVTVGDQIRITGAEKGPDDYRYFENKIRCPAPFWGAAEVYPLP